MAYRSERELVIALARDAVARTAPEELSLLDATARAYFAAPRRAAQAQNADDVLGFGVETAVAFVTPVALTVAAHALRFAAEQVGGVVQEEVGGVVRNLLRRFFARFRRTPGDEGPPVLAALTDQQLRAVRESALIRAQNLGLAHDQAALMADAIVGGLVLPRALP